MHVDYVSMVVHKFPATQCAAYVQKTPLSQCCTCEVQLCDHIATNNSYKSVEPWNTLEGFTDSNGPSSDVNEIGFPDDGMDSLSTPNSIFFSSYTAEETLDLVTLAHTSSPYISSCAFSSSRNVRNTGIHFIPTPISSPSGSGTASGIHPGITQTPTFSSDDSFVRYLNNFINTYVRPPGLSMNGSSECTGHLNATSDATHEAWLYPYAQHHTTDTTTP
ncbi:hypothetical protein EDD85DRAFT_940792 [Armillaria nabsnona]|nr:hypothetical protein EDD85DRAFT_940792 [Armillaria nabsnona]